MKKTLFGILDPDRSCLDAIKDGTGFLLDTSIVYSDYLNSEKIEDIKQIFSLDGIYSYKFGFTNQIDTRDPIMKKMYTCKCHQTYGIENLNKVCQDCNTVVRRSIPMREGWFDLRDNYILHPLICALIFDAERKIVGKAVTDIYEDEAVVIKDGYKKKDASKVSLFELLSKKKIDYTWEDLLFNKNKLEEFLRKNFANNNSYKLLNLMKNKMYVSKLNVLSADYRSIKINKVIGVPEIIQDPLNIKYMNISECIRRLNEDPHMLRSIKISYLVDIMRNVAEIYTALADAVGGGKEAIIRSMIYAFRVPMSARFVLEPMVGGFYDRIDVCEIPIDGFRALFGEDIIKVMNTMPEISLETRERILDIDITLTEEEKDLIEFKIFPQVENKYVYINREPCTYITSILSLEVVKLSRKENSIFEDELVIRVPFFLLPALAGDFDGDVLTVITWGTPEERLRIYELLNPKRFIVNSTNITWNRRIGPNNNTSVLLYKGFEYDATIRKVQ